MRTLTFRFSILSVLVFAGPIGPAAQSPRSASSAPSRPLVTQVEYERWQAELSNWGRWGTDDEMGTLNLVTAAKRKAAAGLVREGVTVSLASDAHTEKAVDVPCPIEWAMVTASEAGATDRIAYPCIHGSGTTHLDSFAHRFFHGKMWNGYAVSGLVTREGGGTAGSTGTIHADHWATADPEGNRLARQPHCHILNNRVRALIDAV